MAGKFKKSRKELYDILWKTPITYYAHEHRVSYTKLKEACNKYNIPTPDQQYWVSLRLGKKLPKTPLPSGEDVKIEIPRMIPKNKGHMSAELNSKANTSCILRILELNTDINHGLSTKEIIDKMDSSYGLGIDRRTVSNSLKLLKLLGYNIVYEKQKYKLLLSYKDNYSPGKFESDEVQNLLDSIRLNPFLSETDERALFYKTKKLMGRFNCGALHNVHLDKRNLSATFYQSLDSLTDAMLNNKKVSFDYMRYDNRGKLVKIREEAYIVSPIHFRYTNFKVFAECIIEDGSKRLYRVDKMENVQLLEEIRQTLATKSIKDTVSANIHRGEIMLVAKCKNEFSDEIVDYFNLKGKLKPNDDGKTFTLTVKTDFNEAREFAVKHIDSCEVIEPPELKDEVIKTIKNNIYGV